MVQMVTGMDAQATVTCIDGVGAFDHVLRASIFRQLLAHEHLRELVPYVRAWCGTAPEYVWVDDDGVQHTVAQGEGGEQGDALMPALFSVALKPALSAIQARLGPGELVVAYLDDIYLITAPENARRAYDITAEVLRQMCGIEVNQSRKVGLLEPFWRCCSSGHIGSRHGGPHSVARCGWVGRGERYRRRGSPSRG